ncbi:MAG TPA: chemotaxis protein CheX, partial [Candidatus Pygmaiobacter gallistercoris]|nr:chemotaxis protein CheX [Candidatus Pygmaiobacter gallistercoris]
GEQAAEEEKFFDRYVDLFADSALEVIGSMAGIDRANARLQMTSLYRPEGEIFVRLGLIGDLAGEVVFGFEKGLALSLLASMTGMELTELDELVQSALCELTNIACGNAATALAGRGLACDIKSPVLETAFSGGADGTGARIELPGGRLSIGVLL